MQVLSGIGKWLSVTSVAVFVFQAGIVPQIASNPPVLLVHSYVVMDITDSVMHQNKFKCHQIWTSLMDRLQLDAVQMWSEPPVQVCVYKPFEKWKGLEKTGICGAVAIFIGSLERAPAVRLY